MYDAIIVGAGPAGGVSALRLAQAGFRVLCLEQGDWQDPQSFPSAQREIEVLATKDWNPNPNVRQHPEDYPVDTSDSDMDTAMFNGVGGGTVLFGGSWHRALPEDFEVRTRDGVADDWPLGYQELAPFYDRTFKMFGVSGLSGDPRYPDRFDYATPPLPAGSVGVLGAQGMKKLGWHFWPASNAIASRPTEWLSACVGWGTCGQGCPEGAKGAADVAVWKAAIQTGAELRTRCRARAVTLDSSGRARGVVYLDAQGVEHEVTASVVIVAANAIGTARLLQLSATAEHPDGLGNSSGLLGRNLMMHPYIAVNGIFDDWTEAWTGPWGNRLYSLEFYGTSEERDFVRGAKWSLNPAGGPLFSLSSYDYDQIGANAEAWGPTHHDYVQKRVGHMMSWDIIAEDLPEETNRVILDDSRNDAYGIPGARIEYKISENTRRMIDFNVARATEAMQASGATEVAPHFSRAGGWHLYGTTKMGTDPATSVTDQWGETHDVDNLFLLGASTFVTSFGVNPTATIAALALRTAEYIISNRSNTAKAI
ncbi:GMC family oxidoreductase [Microbacterium sp.]|uniref:GMC family oxidoreductase n=1 Tax=Microbacterium sp. TaxID=51671 RepID=UPI0035B48F59